MKAIIELERFGYVFSIVGDHLEYSAPDDLADEVAAYFWLLRLGENKNEATEFIKKNEAAKNYAAVLDKWEQDPIHENESRYVEQLLNIAIDGGLPCYENGGDDGGPDAWRRLLLVKGR